MKFQIKCTGIYMITHKPTEQYYIGKSVDIFTRWSQHYTDLKMRKHTSTKLQELFILRPVTEFKFEILSYYSLTDFKALNEGKSIKLINSLFNKYLLQEEKRYMKMYSVNLSLNKQNKSFG